MDMEAQLCVVRVEAKLHMFCFYFGGGGLEGMSK